MLQLCSGNNHVEPPRDHLSIRTFFDEVRQAGSYDEGLRVWVTASPNVRMFRMSVILYRSLLKRNPENRTSHAVGLASSRMNSRPSPYQANSNKIRRPSPTRNSGVKARFIRHIPRPAEHLFIMRRRAIQVSPSFDCRFQILTKSTTGRNIKSSSMHCFHQKVIFQ